jgi:cellulose synthase/poly-beta-1,6-N-acetylglucosamine synthase-like glycosyltransferase
MIYAAIAFGSMLALITLPGTLELLLLTVAGILPARKQRAHRMSSQFRMVIVVPAHNEVLNIARCVKSLLAADQSGIARQVVVVADNCEDKTADAAAAAGARVLVRTNAEERGKGYALDFAFRALMPDGPDAFVVVDADSEVAPNFLTGIAGFLEAGADAVQCRYLVRNVQASMRTRLMTVALSAFNVLRPRGRDRLALSVGIYGNGFALSAATLRAVPYGATSVVEDLEYHLALIRAGRKVRFADGTAVYGDMPTGGTGVKTQRARWEGGRFRMLVEKAPGLARSVLGGNFAFLEPCLDLMLLPLAFHVSLLVLAALTPFWPVRGVALAGLSIVALHLLTGIRVTGGGWREVTALLGAPFYVLWKILLLPRIFRSSRSGAAWVRTERNIP